MGVLVATTALVASLWLVGCGGGKPAADDKDTQEEAPVTQVEDTEQESTDESSTEGVDGGSDATATDDLADYLDVSGVDFSSPDVVVEEGDYDGMVDLMHDLGNFAIEEGSIVDVTGSVGPTTMTHSIMVSDDAGTSHGFNYVVPGLDDGEYPPDGTPIHITGVVRMSDYGYLIVVVPQENYEIL